ncbi:MAG: hypothetical protein LBC31_02415 [Treponema sp.]|jgi:hypothetical protein|nr:hypothetical protein [Treponema sp.]
MKAPFVFLLLAAASAGNALDLWQYPEMADRNALFTGGFAAEFSVTEGFALPPPEFYLDYLLPAGLPVSLGAYFVTPRPNLTSFGLRAAYHIDLGNENVDLYALYVFDLGFLRSDTLRRYGDEARELRYYDFRAGVRRRFGRFVCLTVETGFKLQSVRFGISVKLY